MSYRAFKLDLYKTYNDEGKQIGNKPEKYKKSLPDGVRKSICPAGYYKQNQ